jgi:DNA-binding GntR family transcriptional regulator
MMATRTKRSENANFPLKSLTMRKSLGGQVHEKLKRAIVHGELKPSSRIVEARVAEALGISRTPVREAIHKLEREGFIRQDPRGGFFVVGLALADIEETFGIRSVLESYAARLAAFKHRPEDLKPLERKLEEYQAHLDRGELGSLPRINTEFHDLLYGLSRSPRLVRMISDLRDQIYRFRKAMLRVEEMARTSNQDHREMLALIRKRDGEGVEGIVRAHILKGQEAVVRLFDLGELEEEGNS